MVYINGRPFFMREVERSFSNIEYTVCFSFLYFYSSSNYSLVFTFLNWTSVCTCNSHAPHDWLSFIVMINFGCVSGSCPTSWICIGSHKVGLYFLLRSLSSLVAIVWDIIVVDGVLHWNCIHIILGFISNE